MIPRKTYRIEADIFWVILMGPENFELDINRIRLPRDCIRILFLFDTFPSQYRLIRHISSCFHFDLLITSFKQAALPLSLETSREWSFIPQAVPSLFIEKAPRLHRKYAFASFGRREPTVDKAVSDYCRAKSLAYITTDSDKVAGMAGDLERYYLYSDLLSDSIFNLCWSVQETSPARAGGLDPVTARWFEASAAGNVIIGARPTCQEFADILPGKPVFAIDRRSSLDQITDQLDQLWSKRAALSEKAREYASQHGYSLTWDERLDRAEEILRAL
jgi:hypothetical protein